MNTHDHIGILDETDDKPQKSVTILNIMNTFLQTLCRKCIYSVEAKETATP